MKQLTVKYPSGLEVNLAAFLLKMTYHTTHSRVRGGFSSVNNPGRWTSEPSHRTGDRRRHMNANLFKDNWDSFSLDLKKQWERFTDEDLLKIQGNYDMFMAVAMERYPERRDGVSRWAYEWFSVVPLPIGS